MPDGHPQKPGGSNRIILEVADLPGRIEELKQAGLHFRNRMETGPGGRQIQLIRMAIRSNCSSLRIRST
jgi:glyoxylase I family protein